MIATEPLPPHSTPLDIILISEKPKEFLKNRDWVLRFGDFQSIKVESYGITTSLFVDYTWGLEVEFSITSTRWSALPLDTGSARVIGDGITILYDPTNALRDAVHAVAT